MRRYIESALRIKLRLLICSLVVFGLAFAFLSTTKGGFTSSSTVWVEKPLYIQDQSSDINRYVSAATIQANMLTELMGTRQFTLGIAERAGIPMNTESAQGRAIDDIQKKLNIEATGSHVIRLSYTGDRPDYCQAIISETIKSFLVQLDAGRAQQGAVALKIYQQQRTEYQKQADKSRDALNKYIQNNPGVLAPGAQSDPTLADLQQQYNDDRTRLSDIITKIDDLNTQLDAGNSVTTDFFRVIDEPSKVSAYKATTKDLIRNVLIAVGLALFTMVALTLVGTWTDVAVYTLNDVSTLALADADGDSRELLVGTVPYVRSLGSMRHKQLKEGKGSRQRGSSEQSASGTGRPKLTTPNDCSPAWTSDTPR